MMQWDMELDSITPNTYDNTASLLQCQSLAPIVLWEAAKSMLEQCSIFLEFLWGPPEKHRTVYTLMLLIGVADEVNYRLQEQAQHHPKIPSDLVQLTQTEFK